MYTNLENVQVIISLLKQFNIKKVVISPGSRNVPFVHSIENDDFFDCYSIVDERSAAFFALGMAEKSEECVVITCTSSTATANYLPAIVEAKKNKVKIIALTFDRDYRKLYKMEDQMINQISMYGENCIRTINVPIIKDKADKWFAVSNMNEILILQSYIEANPIQINVQIDEFGDFSCEKLPEVRKVDYYDEKEFIKNLNHLQKELSSYKRILVLCGQSMRKDDELKQYLENFQEKFSSIISYDDFSVAKSKKFIKTLQVTESMHIEEFEDYAPDLVITIGGHVWSFIKYKLRHVNDHFVHWNISSSVETKDAFDSLTKFFNFEEMIFFKKIIDCNYVSNREYYDLWKTRLDRVIFPDFKYSNFYAIKELLNIIPQNSLIHMSILNSIRISNFIGTPDDSKCYANLGADGIDGCLSTFLGQSVLNNSLSFLIIGDLSSLYDYSAFQYFNRPNQRIMVINNNVGSEFYNNFGSYINTIDNFIGAKHNSSLKGVCEFNNVTYMSSKNIVEFNQNVLKFVNESNDKPILLEVFTDPLIDTTVLGDYYKSNLHTSYKIKLKKIFKKLKKGI